MNNSILFILIICGLNVMIVSWIKGMINVTTNRLLITEIGKVSTRRGRVCRLKHAHDALAVVACPAQ